MTERINLEVPAVLDSLPIVRRVLGGLGARLAYSLDDLDDLYLSCEEIIRTALCHETPERLALGIEVEGTELTVHIGSFASEALRDQLRTTSTAPGDVDLACLLGITVDTVEVVSLAEGGYEIVFARRRRSSLS